MDSDCIGIKIKRICNLLCEFKLITEVYLQKNYFKYDIDATDIIKKPFHKYERAFSGYNFLLISRSRELCPDIITCTGNG